MSLFRSHSMLQFFAKSILIIYFIMSQSLLRGESLIICNHNIYHLRQLIVFPGVNHVLVFYLFMWLAFIYRSLYIKLKTELIIYWQLFLFICISSLRALYNVIGPVFLTQFLPGPPYPFPYPSNSNFFENPSSPICSVISLWWFEWDVPP